MPVTFDKALKKTAAIVEASEMHCTCADEDNANFGSSENV